MNEVVRARDLDRGYKILLVHTHKAESIGDFDLYGVEVQDKTGGTAVVLNSGCIGEKSGYYWLNNGIEYMERLMLLLEARDMAYHNKFCYSKTYAMDTPKDGYEDEWLHECEKAQMIEKWLFDHSNYFGKNNEKSILIRVEFDIKEEM